MLKVPLTKPYFTNKEIGAVAKVIKSGWVTQGRKVAELEKLVANFVGAKYAIATSNCTTALHACLLVLGIGIGDEVIVPSFTFIATVNSILYVGAKPIFIDIEPKTYNIDPDLISSLITKNTKAIMPVDQIGLTCDIAKIKKIARRYNLIVVEDAAPSIGAKYKNKMVGSIADATCFSFHPRKVITTGEGGIVTTNSKQLTDKLKVIRNHGASVSDIKRHEAKKVIFEKYKVLGYNFRMTDIQAVIGIEQMKKLDWILKKRKYFAKRYNEKLSAIEEVEIPYSPPYTSHTYQSYIIRLTKKAKTKQVELMEKLLKKGIATRRGVMASHLEPLYKKLFGKVILPETEKAAKETILLPLYPTITEKEQDYAIQSLKDCL